jgi:hypothetical protein
MKLSLAILVLLTWAWTPAVLAQAPPAEEPAGLAPALEPPTGLTAKDHGWDDGTKADLSWNAPAVDLSLVKKYKIYKAESADGEFTPAGEAEKGATSAVVEKLTRGKPYFFRVTLLGMDGAESAPAMTTTAVVPTRQWFDGDRFYLFFVILIFCGSVIYWIYHARSGREVKVRKIAGLEAVDEAVGRATEMGRSCLFIPGIQDMNDIQTIAGLNVLSRVSKVAAEFDARVEVPTSRSLVMTAARETVQASYLSAGRPDAYNQDLIYYVTDEQFGYVAYIQGMMSREKPAACFYMGAFFAESLILAEMGNTIGAIQVAGTAMPAQLPFFVAACDYTLIGEEFFAASAYLSGEPDQLGSLKGQDVGKIIVAIGIVVGVTLATLANILGNETGLGATFQHAVDFLRDRILT